MSELKPALILIFFVAFAHSATPDCDPFIWSKCITYDTGYNGTKQYLLPRTDADRLGGIDVAAATCAKYNTTTVSIHSETENDLIQKWMESVTTTVWLGAVQNNGVWSWQDGSPFDYTKWYNGKILKPPKGIDCVYFLPRNRGQWTNGSEYVQQKCTDTNTIICQRKVETNSHGKGRKQ